MDGAMSGMAAILYAVLAAWVAGFQAALAAGAPWADPTLGGEGGRLPQQMRFAAGVQAVLQMALAAMVLGASGVVVWSAPGWTVWLAAAIAGLAAGLNLVSPAALERRIWAPVAGGMMVSALVVALGW